MVKPVSLDRDAPKADSLPGSANAAKGDVSKDETNVRPWPGTSQPGHIRPIGPAYPAGRGPAQDPPADK